MPQLKSLATSWLAYKAMDNLAQAFQNMATAVKYEKYAKPE